MLVVKLRLLIGWLLLLLQLNVFGVVVAADLGFYGGGLLSGVPPPPPETSSLVSGRRENCETFVLLVFLCF